MAISVRRFIVAIGLSAFCLVAIGAHSSGVKTSVARGRGGAVATISHEASKAALDILNKGGNAVDAAVAAAAVLGVTDPFSCGIGGGGFMMVYLAGDKRVITIDHRETAPRGASSTMFLENGNPLPIDDAIASGLSVGVPGTVRGWYEVLSRYGSRKLKDVLQPAISIAKKGFVVDQNFHRLIKVNEEKFSQFTSTTALYLRKGKALAVGTRFKNPDMARAYNGIAKRGLAYFYRDDIANAIVAAVQQPPTVNGVTVKPGTMTKADLIDYEVRIRAPIKSTYRGHEIFGMNLPSSGGIAIGEALNILEHFELNQMKRADVEHAYLETSRLVYADRNEFVGDPDFTQVPVLGLLSKDYAAQRKSLINAERVLKDVHAGNPYEFQNPSVRDQGRLSAPTTLSEESEHTTHLTVVDSHGNIVMYTFTIEDWGGSGIVVPGFGFLLNNELTDFGFTGTNANLPAPLKRPRSSMSPTLVVKDGKPILSLGSPGGSTIITTVLQTLVNFFDLGMPIDQALEAPRLSQQNRDLTIIEPTFLSSASKSTLEQYGHQWTEPREIGAANAIYFAEDGTVTAVSEKTRHGGGSALVQYSERAPPKSKAKD